MSVATTFLNCTIFAPLELYCRMADARNDRKRLALQAKVADKLAHYTHTVVGNMEVAETVNRSHYRINRTTAEVTVVDIHTGELRWNASTRMVKAVLGHMPLEKLAHELIYNHGLKNISIIRDSLAPVAQYVYCLHIPAMGWDVEDGKGDVLFFSALEIAEKAAVLHNSAFGGEVEVRFSVEYGVDVYK